MRSLKKVLALLTVIAMIFSTTAAFGATFKDVDGTDYEAAVVTLSSLDVLNGYEDGTFKPEGDITRAEFAKVIIAVMNMTASAGKTATSFTDVGADNWASGYVKLAEQMGVIKGYGNGKFGPDDKVTYEQAVKMIVAALGFTPKAEALGGYPTGYMVVAAQEEITKGIKADASKAASRGVVAQLVYNALEVEMMEQTGYGTDVTYEQGEKTLLKDYLEVTVYEEVQVIANEYTSLTSATGGVDEGKVKIDLPADADNSETMEVNGTNAAQLLGYIVDVYVNEDDEIISINKSDDMNVELAVMANDIVSYNATTNVLKYEVDDEDEEADLVEDAKLVVIKNGKADTEADVVPSEGKVVLVDLDDDEKFDVVVATETANEVVEDVVVARDKINFKDDFGGGALTLDPEDDDYDFVILKDGKEIEIKDIKEWDVLSIAKSDDNELYTVYVTSGESVKGKVSEEEDADKYIDGKKYEVANNIDEDEIALGDEGTFYLDMYGKIAAYDTETESDNYALITKAGSTSGINAGFEFELLTFKGEEKVYSLASKVKYDGSTDDDEDIAAKMVTDGVLATSTYALVKVTLITYELDENGDLKEINVVDKNATLVNGDVKADLEFDDSDKALGSGYYIDDKTIVFDVTEASSADYEVKGASFFIDEDEYDVKVYDVDDSVAGVVLVLDSSSSGRIGTNFAIVDRLTSTKNADDDDVYKLYAVNEGKEVTLMTTDDLYGTGSDAKAVNANVYFKDLAMGSVISYKTDVEGNINDFALLFDGNVTATGSTTDGDLEVKFGTVTDTTSRGITVGNINYTVSGATVYEYDADADDIDVVDNSDITDEDKVFILKYDGKVKVIVIVK